MADLKADLDTARAAVKTVAATSILPTTTLASSTYTWGEQVDDIEAAMKAAHGHAGDARFHRTMIAFYTAMEAELAL